MAAVRSLRCGDDAARTAALPILRLVRNESLRASQRSRPAQARQPWRGAAVSVALHAALLAAFLWQVPGGEPASGTAVEVVFWTAAAAPAESPSGDVQMMEIAEASAPAAAVPLQDVPPVDAPVASGADPEPPRPVELATPAEPDPPPPEPVTEVAANALPDVPPPVEPAAIAPVEPIPLPEPVAQVAIASPPAQPLPPPPPPRPVVSKRPIETPPRPKPDAAPAAPAAETARAASRPTPTAAAAASAPASAPLPQGDIPVVHDARFREPPAPARYPPRAVDLSQQGTVIVRALVTPDGTADDIIVWRSSGYALLDAAALRAVRKWSFEPASVASRRITAWVEVPVRFAIR